MAQHQRILDELEPLFEKAEKQGLWFYTKHGNSWFSPEKLRLMHENGCHIWGKENWQLKDPEERLAQLRSEKRAIEEKIKRFEIQLNQ
ncbi:hypothetical protein LX73_2316 [Fodinibius salinus]|uniref:Uncharacterized protein n=1 Tax=Fodinibius salinus TaxID=860790 RepID=A0A5D3YIK3_9BACT|nr:hypothetical protein [Fodinibius salinus]TYP92070.1 hypothetical protein LX73_2316 [Fodinibius salinus]